MVSHTTTSSVHAKTGAKAMSLTTVFEQEAVSQLDALHSFAYQLCRDEQRSRDLVQETMLKACMYFHTYREGTNCRAWLFQICKNSYINEYRRKHYETIPVDFQEDGSARYSEWDATREIHPAPVDESVPKTHERLFGDELMTALLSLPQEYQTAVLLSDVEDYTYEEIAEFTRAPIGTVRSRIHRGRKLMARRLGRQAHAQHFGGSTITRN
jgi:RNA polymerase sigma-70 factor (ECF subfamily)